MSVLAVVAALAVPPAPIDHPDPITMCVEASGWGRELWGDRAMATQAWNREGSIPDAAAGLTISIFCVGDVEMAFLWAEILYWLDPEQAELVLGWMFTQIGGWE